MLFQLTAALSWFEDVIYYLRWWKHHLIAKLDPVDMFFEVRFVMLFLKVASRNARIVIQRSWSSCSTLGIWFNTSSASSDHHLVRSYFRHLNPCLGWIMKNLRKHSMCLLNYRIALPWVSSGLLSQNFNLFLKWIVIRNINHQELIRLVEFRSPSGCLLEIYHLSTFDRFRYLYSSWF